VTARDQAFEAFFHERYERIIRVVARVVRDPARAEEIAVEAFWKLWRSSKTQDEQAGGWLYRTAVRLALDDLRRHARRLRSELAMDGSAMAPGPEQAHAEDEAREQVRQTLAALDSRSAEMLLMRSNGLSYSEVATALDLNPASVGTLLTRAQQAFRKEYVKRYGEPINEQPSGTGEAGLGGAPHGAARSR
jgi:RNA polymerase sigma-70 factor (ECF subfamily)